MNHSDIIQARLSESLDNIIDSDGNTVDFDDPRIVHIGAIDGSRYAKQLMKIIYQKHHRKLRTIETTNADTMQLARKLCSGRECVPMTAMVGAVLNDVTHNRKDDEISIYFTLDQTGPCQNGAWPAVWESMGKRLNLRNAIFGVWPDEANHRLGLSDDVVNGFVKCYVLGDLMDEAVNALSVVAKDKHSALEIFESEFQQFAGAFLEDDSSVKSALDKWAKNIAGIPRMAGVEETPKVLIFGGLNLQFVHYPLTEYFIGQGIIPKVVDATEGMLWLSSEPLLRNGFKSGRTDPKRQFRLPILLFSWLFSPDNREEARNSIKTKIGLLYVERMMKQFRHIMKKSGLMFDAHVSFTELAAAGHRYVTYNGFTETAVTTGRYVHAVKQNRYDGLINIGSFNCQPAMNSQAVIRPLANKNDMPYAAIDCEGPWLSANQRRLLEAIAVQAKRRKKNSGSFRY